MASKPVDMTASERHLLEKLQGMSKAWYWRDDLGLIQAVYSTGARGLAKRGIIQVRKTPGPGGKGRHRIEVRLKAGA